MDDFLELVFNVGVVCFTCVLIVGVVFSVVCLVDYVWYRNFFAHETITLDGKLIYSGPGRSTWWEQLGENGNKYCVKIYDEGFWNKFFGRVERIYTGDNLQIVSDK